VGGAFVLSRVLGLVREAVIAGQFGTSGQYDAYVVAFRVPDTLFLLIIGGAVGSAFIPVFTGLMAKGRERDAWNLASTLINVSVVVLSLAGLVMGIFAPQLVGWIIAPGMPPARQQVVVDLTRILLLSPLFLGLGGWAMGILNARQSFALPALAPVAYNLSIIAGALFLVPSMGVFGLAWGVVVGALLHFGLQVPGLVRAGMRYSLRLNVRDPGAGEVGKLLLPRIVGQAAFQANIIAMSTIGSFLQAGRISAFNYAYLIMLLPHGIFAMSLATVTFPTMAAQYAESNLDAMRSTLARAVRVLLSLTIPSAVGMFVLRYEIVAAIFQFGAFTSSSTELVAGALGYFALGLVAYAVVEVLTRGFYALHDTITPVIVSIATVAINLALASYLALGLGMSHEGLALSLASTTTVEMILLWVLLGRKLPGWRLSNEGILSSTVRSASAAAAMGIMLALSLPWLHTLIPAALGTKAQVATLSVAGIAVGALVYLVVAIALRSEEVKDARGLLFRRIGKRV
jgi:putative peptidoglycan lipid II flippase